MTDDQFLAEFTALRDQLPRNSKFRSRGRVRWSGGPELRWDGTVTIQDSDGMTLGDRAEHLAAARTMVLQWLRHNLGAGRKTRVAAAARAVVTKTERHAKDIHELAKKMLTGWQVGQRSRCCVCTKALTDDVSIARGIGPECWQHVMNDIDWIRGRQAETARRILAGETIAPIITPPDPTPGCALRCRQLRDRVQLDRGLCSECWSAVQERVTGMQAGTDVLSVTEDAGSLWSWHAEKAVWIALPVLRTTDKYVLVLTGRESNVRAVPRSDLEANGRVWGYYNDAGKAAFDVKRAGAIVYPLLGLPAGMPRDVISVAQNRARDALCREVPMEQRNYQSAEGKAFWERYRAIEDESSAARRELRERNEEGV